MRAASFTLFIALLLSFVIQVFFYTFTPISQGTYRVLPGTTITGLQEIFLQKPSIIAKYRYKIWLKSPFGPPKNFQLQAGTYTVAKDTFLGDIFITTLTRPDSQDRSITLLPGWNIWDIEMYLQQENILSGSIMPSVQTIIESGKYPFLKGRKSLEGFLFADTYRIPLQYSPQQVLELLLNQFAKNFEYELSNMSRYEFYKTLIIASLIEREERFKPEQTGVSGVISNRIAAQMPLGIDATTCYAFEISQKQCTPKFIWDHIYENTPYNTRTQQGLPPTPISAISQSSWNAAKNPRKSDNYYYLHDTQGTIYYAQTLEEHNRNKREKMWR